MGKSIMVASGKGGTGKSTFAINLGLSLAYQNKKVILVDLNVGLRTLDLYLSLENRALFDIGDVLSNTADLDSVIIQSDYNDNLFLLPGTQKQCCKELSSDSLSEIVSKLKEDYDYVFLDCPPGVGPIIDYAADASDMAITVINANYVCLRDADVLEDILSKKGIFTRMYVINRISSDLANTDTQIELKTVNQRMRSTLLGIIPDDCNIKAASNIGIPIVLKRDTYIARNFDNISNRLMETYI